MQWLIAIIAIFAVFVHVSLRVDLLPVGEEMRVENGPVDLVAVEGDCVDRAGRDPNYGLSAGAHCAPCAGHSYEVAPRVQGVAISENVLSNCWSTYAGQAVLGMFSAAAHSPAQSTMLETGKCDHGIKLGQSPIQKHSREHIWSKGRQLGMFRPDGHILEDSDVLGPGAQDESLQPGSLGANDENVLILERDDLRDVSVNVINGVESVAAHHITRVEKLEETRPSSMQLFVLACKKNTTSDPLVVFI